MMMRIVCQCLLLHQRLLLHLHHLLLLHWFHYIFHHHPSLSLAPPSSSSEVILPRTEEVKEIEEATEAIYEDLYEKYRGAVDEVMAEWDEIKYSVGIYGYDRHVEDGMNARGAEQLDALKEDYEERIRSLEDQLAKAAVKLPEPNKFYSRPSGDSSATEALRNRYPSILSKYTPTEEQEETRMQKRLVMLSNWLDDPESQKEIEKHKVEADKKRQKEEAEAAEAKRIWEKTRPKVAPDSTPFEPETQEEAERRKAEAKRIDMEAASRLKKEEVLKSVKESKAMLRLESIVWSAKKSSNIDRRTEDLLQSYLKGEELKTLYMDETPKKDQSKEGWRQFKENVRAVFGKRKLELMSEKEKSNISAFPYSSDESGSSSDSEEEVQSPKTPSKAMTRSVEIAKKFGEVTPAAASRVGTAASPKPSESNSDTDDDEEYFSSMEEDEEEEEEEEEKDFDSNTYKSKAVTKILDGSRSTLKRTRQLSKSDREDILEDLWETCVQLERKGITRLRAMSFMKDGTIQYYTGNKSVFETKLGIKEKLKSLRSKSDSKTVTVTKKSDEVCPSYRNFL